MVEDYSIRNEFSVYNAKRFMDSVPDNKLYVFLGKTSEWSDELDPPTPTPCEQDMLNAYRDMLIFKRISTLNLSLAIKRNLWQAGTVYQPWDSQDGLLAEKTFFVITSDNRVYKCLDSIPNTPSTIEPKDTGVTPVRLSDGYTWKFMYDISTSDMEKYKDTEVIPVKILTDDDGSLQYQVQEYAVPGTINHIEVLEGGSGYTSAPAVTIDGDGQGATATAVLDGDKVSYILVSNTGQGYTWATATVTGTSSVTAQARVILSPVNGHGSNASEELLARYVITTVTFDNDEDGKFPVDTKFRQIGLLSNPTLWNSSTIADLSGASVQYTTLNCSGFNGTFIEGEWLKDTTSGKSKVAQVIRVSSNNILVNNIKAKINDNDQLQGESSGTSAEVISVVEPTLKPFSGEMLYIENRQPISKIENQSETYRLIIKF